MGARGRLSAAIALMSVVSLAQGLEFGDLRMPGEDEPGLGLGGPDCLKCAEPLRVDPLNSVSALCVNEHLNLLGPNGLPVPPGGMLG